jgi:hypothetical protein
MGLKGAMEKINKPNAKAAGTLIWSELMQKSDLTLADQIERTNHALTADELAHILAVSNE